MKIEQMEVTKLIPYANNAKLHDDAQVASIAGSIREFGFNNPVLIDKDGGIIAGHGRVLAARKLALDKVPCIRLGHLTENQKRAYIIADNRLAETGGGWDRDMLKIELEDINFGEFDNFTMDDLGDLAINFDDIEKSGDATGDNQEDNIYTNKVVSPIYEPKGNKPKIKEMIDRTKTEKLQNEIDLANLPDDISNFLKHAAERHTVFHFGNIAEFYCHANGEVQDLMEKSGMIIIDFKKAIEYGFVHLSEKLGELSELEEEGGGDA